MYELEYESKCEEEIRKKCRKNRALQDALAVKIGAIRQNPHMFKPLRTPMEGLRRVHICGPFVLVYWIDEVRKTVQLVQFSHHDEAY